MVSTPCAAAGCGISTTGIELAIDTPPIATAISKPRNTDIPHLKSTSCSETKRLWPRCGFEIAVLFPDVEIDWRVGRANTAA
jgi:hypothetical protein